MSNRVNWGTVVFSLTFFLYTIPVTFGLPVISVMIIQLILALGISAIRYKGKICCPKSLLLWIIPLVVISFNVKNWSDLNVLKYVIWFLVGLFTITVSTKTDNSKITYDIVIVLALIVFLSLLIQIIAPSFFSAVIEPFIKAKDTYYYIFNRNHGIKYGIACDKGAANLAGTLCIGVAFFSGYHIKFNKYKKWIIILVSAFLCAMSGSRTSLVLIPLSIYVVYLLSAPEKKKILIVFRGIILANVGFALILFLGKVFPNITVLNRISETATSFISNNDFGVISSGRDLLYAVALSGIKNNPLLGHGWFQFNVNNVGIINEGTASYVHNIILQLLYDTGIIGTCLFLIPYAYFYIKTIEFLLHYMKYKDEGIVITEILISAYLQTQLLLDSLLHVGILDTLLLQVYFFAIALYFVAKRKAIEYSY